MKKNKACLLLLIGAILIQSVTAQTADEIINKYVEAIGGAEKIGALKSVKMTGTLNVQGFDVGIVVTGLHQVGMRTDIAVPGMSDGFQLMNTKKGWNFFPFQGQAAPQEVAADQVKAGQAALDLQGPLFNYQSKGNKVELVGKEILEAMEVYKLKLTNSLGKVSTFFFDTKTFYRVKSITSAVTPEGEMDVETTYANFRKTPEGYVFPFSTTTTRGTLLFSTIEINQAVDEKIFTAE